MNSGTLLTDVARPAVRLERHLPVNRPGKSGDSFAWKGKRNVHTEKEANAAREETSSGSSVAAQIPS